MTTIVCNRTTMVADKRATGNHIMRVTKIFRVNGGLIGISGNIEQARRFIEWRRNPDAKPTFSDSASFAALELTSEGEIIWWGVEMVGVPIEDEYFSIGSGSAYALGALTMGASLKDAIKVAARWDEATGNEVQTMSLRRAA